MTKYYIVFIVFQLDDWVLCRIYKKKNVNKVVEPKMEESSPQMDITRGNEANEEQMLKFPRTYSLSHLLDMDYLGPVSQFLSDNSFNSAHQDFLNNTLMTNSGTGFVHKVQFGGEIPYQNSDSGRFQAAQSSTFTPGYDMYCLDRC